MQKKKDYREFVSLPLYNRILLFSELEAGDNLLFIYDKNTEKFRPFQSFTRIGLEKSELCLHFHQNHSRGYTLGKFIDDFSQKQKYFRIPLRQSQDGELDVPATREMVDNIIKPLDKSLYSGVRFLGDFGELVKTTEKMDQVLAWEDGLLKQLSKMGPVTRIDSFDADSLDASVIGRLSKRYRKVLVSAHSETTFYLPEFSSVTREAEAAPALNLISKDIADEYVKSSIETLLLSMLRERNLCGYDLLKEIYQKFGVLLSQGTIYPLLHHLEARGLLVSETSPATRGKIYSPTEKGKELIDRRVDEFLKMQSYVASIIGRQTGAK